MIYYFLPASGIFGGVKVACRFMEMLGSLGVRGAVVVPQGEAPEWFEGRVAVVSEAAIRHRVRTSDWLMFSWPPDYERLKTWPGRLVCHCQGTDDAMHPVFADPDVPVLTCWREAQEYVRQHFGRATTHVGISIPDCFFFAGGRKVDNEVAYMPRRGFPIVRRAMRHNPFVDFSAIDGMNERDVAARLQKAGIFLATSMGEYFGLPALEAMAAGCVVISVPVKGGQEYLHSGMNCLVAEPDAVPATLRRAAARGQAGFRSAMRIRALATASTYRSRRQLDLLRPLVRGDLGWLR